MCFPFPAQVSILAISANCTCVQCTYYKTSILDILSLQVVFDTLLNQPNSPATYIHAFKPLFKHCLFLPNKRQTSFFDYFLCTCLSANFSRDQVILEVKGRMIHATNNGIITAGYDYDHVLKASNTFPN